MCSIGTEKVADPSQMNRKQGVFLALITSFHFTLAWCGSRWSTVPTGRGFDSGQDTNPGCGFDSHQAREGGKGSSMFSLHITPTFLSPSPFLSKTTTTDHWWKTWDGYILPEECPTIHSPYRQNR